MGDQWQRCYGMFMRYLFIESDKKPVYNYCCNVSAFMYTPLINERIKGIYVFIISMYAIH